LNSGGTLIALRRTKSGDFDVKNARSVEEWIEIIQEIKQPTETPE
jgi:tRNA pseudouridine55 synthase